MLFTFQLPEQQLRGMKNAAKKRSLELRRDPNAGVEPEMVKRSDWPRGLASQINKAVAWAAEVAASGIVGTEPFHVVVTGHVEPGPGATPTLSVGISGTQTPES